PRFLWIFGNGRILRNLAPNKGFFMHTWITLGPITVSFRTENGLCQIRKVSGYRRKKPEAWDFSDYYIVVDGCEELSACFIGEAKVEVNGEEFEQSPEKVSIADSTVEIKVFADGKVYPLRVHVVQVDETREEKSSGIAYDDEADEWYFEDVGFVEGLFLMFQGAAYEEEYPYDFSVEGYNEQEYERGDDFAPESASVVIEPEPV